MRGDDLTWQEVADAIGETVSGRAGISRHAVASLHRRTQQPRAERAIEPGLKPRTVRYVHTILHAALKDAVRWNRLARNVADAADPPSVPCPRSRADRSSGTATSCVRSKAGHTIRLDPGIVNMLRTWFWTAVQNAA
ncbi:hypothetical protein BH24ACT4_BH24ACT4_07080 [soil metagenome]